MTLQIFLFDSSFCKTLKTPLFQPMYSFVYIVPSEAIKLYKNTKQRPRRALSVDWTVCGVDIGILRKLVVKLITVCWKIFIYVTMFKSRFNFTASLKPIPKHIWMIIFKSSLKCIFTRYFRRCLGPLGGFTSQPASRSLLPYAQLMIHCVSIIETNNSRVTADSREDHGDALGCRVGSALRKRSGEKAKRLQ